MIRIVTLVSALCAFAATANAAEIKVMTTGAPKQVVQTVADGFQSATVHKVTFVQDTAGGVRRRIEAGESADIIVATPEVLNALTTAGKVAPGSQVDFARTGVGVGIKEGMPRPDISTTEAFKRFIAETPSLALPDPAAGGTSAVFLAGLFQRLGLTEVVKAKARFQAGGYAADLIVKGEAVAVVHQISEIIPVKGVTLVGPLPADIQLISTYTAALPAGTPGEAARAFMAALGGAQGAAAARAAGMDPVR
jgi:molybdate transport system substrate-binding protein